jgi:hypothetical protein
MDRKLKHLDFIQGIINRMGRFSFLLKGWSVMLVSGLFALAAKESNPLFVYIAYLPAIAFWILDGYYLYQERLYRLLFDQIRGREPDDIDFGMDTTIFKGLGNASWSESILSQTMLLFHGILILTIITVMIVCLIRGGANG